MTAEENEMNVALFRRIVAEEFPSEEAQKAASKYSDPELQLIAKLAITAQEYPDDYTIAMAMLCARNLKGSQQVKKAMELYQDPAMSM